MTLKQIKKFEEKQSNEYYKEENKMNKSCDAIKVSGLPCGAYATQYCEDCGKSFCKWHNGRIHGRDKCEDNIEGVHSIWSGKK